MRTLCSSLLLALISSVAFAAPQKGEPVVEAWVKKDIKGVKSVVDLLPFETRNVEQVKARLRKEWHVEETDLGFGGSYLELEKGYGYSKAYIHALLFDGKVARYTAGFESYSDEWPMIRKRILDQWKASKGPEVMEEEHGYVFRKTVEDRLSDYYAAVARALGPIEKADVPPNLLKSYASLTDPMENATLSGTHRDEEIHSLVEAERTDLLENVLRGYNPGARVLAALALIELQQTGHELSPSTSTTIENVLDLSIELHACVYDLCSHVPARNAFEWFDSGKAFPKIRLPLKKP